MSREARNPHVREGQKQVIVIGGGFGGLNAAKTLAGRDEMHVTIIDQRDHLFQPLLYQVATAGLSPADNKEGLRERPRGRTRSGLGSGRCTTVASLG